MEYAVYRAGNITYDGITSFLLSIVDRQTWTRADPRPVPPPHGTLKKGGGWSKVDERLDVEGIACPGRGVEVAASPEAWPV